MNLAKSWAITSKDFAIFRRKPTVLYTLVALPMGVALGFPGLLAYEVYRHHLSFVALIPLVDSFAFFFVIATVVLSTSLGSYSIVGEKVEKSLEPLLATPTTDSEILLGKVLAAFLPTILAMWTGAVAYMTLVDVVSAPSLGYQYYPNSSIAVLLLLVAPLACLLSVEVNVIVSSFAADVRAAQQFGSLLALPFGGLYVLGEVRVITLDSPTLLLIAGALAGLDLLLFFVSRATFRREEILTRWR